MGAIGFLGLHFYYKVLSSLQFKVKTELNFVYLDVLKHVRIALQPIQSWGRDRLISGGFDLMKGIINIT